VTRGSGVYKRCGCVNPEDGRRWLETRQTLRPATRTIYAQLIRDYLKPRLGGVPLRDRDLTVGKVQAMFTALLRANEKRAHPLAPATFQRIREVLRAALNGAIRRGLITQNPARWVEVPRRGGRRRWCGQTLGSRCGGRPATPGGGGVDRGADCCVPGTGSWACVVSVVPCCRAARVAVVCLPKSERSGRTIALDHGTLALLRGLHTEWEAATGGVVVDGWLFTHGDGNHWSPSYITHTFRQLVREADLPPVRFRDLRHGAASLSLAAGNDLKIVQAMLGHASIVLTADTYTSVLPCLAHQAAEATAELVRRAGRDRWQRPPGHTHPKKRHATARHHRGIKRARARETAIVGSHGDHTSGSQINNAHQQDPLHRENLLVGVDIAEYAARDSNPEPAG